MGNDGSSGHTCHRKLTYPTGGMLMSAQGDWSLPGWVAQCSGSTQQYDFLQLRVLGLHRLQGGWRVQDPFISFSKCCRRPDRCTERLQGLYTSATAVKRKRKDISMEMALAPNAPKHSGHHDF